MTFIPFTNRVGFVMTSEPMIQNFRTTDELGRTLEESKFAEQFERIFQAAYTGDLTECMQVVEEGFADFDAVSFGRFRTGRGKSLDNVSLLRVAELYGRRHLVDFLRIKIRSNAISAVHAERTIAEMLALEAAKKYQSELLQSWDQKQNLKSDYYTRLDDDRARYDKQVELLKLMKPRDISVWIHYALETSYTAAEWQEKKPIVDGLIERQDQINFFKKRIEEPFNVGSADARRTTMRAFVDFAEKKWD